MKTKRILAVAKRIILDFINDKRTLALIFIAPVFAMFLFGLAFKGEVRDIRVIVVNSDSGFTAPLGMGRISVSEKIIEHLDKRVLHIVKIADMRDARKTVDAGHAYAIIFFPANFTEELIKRKGNSSYKGVAEIKVLIDRSNITIADSVLRSVGKGVENAMEASGTAMPLKIDTSEALFAKDAKFMDFFVPGIMSFVVYLLTTILTLLTFVNERTNGTLDRMLSTPLREGEVVIGYCLAFSLIGMIQAGLLLGIGILVFHILIAGHIALAFLVIVMLAVTCQALGILLSSLANRELQAIQLFPFIAIPGFLLGGVFWPVEAIPAWLRPLSYCLPVTYAVDACRSVILRGWGIDKIGRDLAMLGVFAVIFISMAMISLKRRR